MKLVPQADEHSRLRLSRPVLAGPSVCKGSVGGVITACALWLQSWREQLKISAMESAGKAVLQPAGHGPFIVGAVVLVTLNSPREKFWGAVLELSGAGLSVCGVDLNSFDDFAAIARSGEAAPGVVFFPMHRVERVELDARSGDIPSLAERFAQKSGRAAAAVLGPDPGISRSQP